MAEEIAKGSAQTSESTIRAWALALFDRAAEAHRLSHDVRRLLESAAGFYAAAGQDDAEQAARHGRDLALAAPIAGLTSDEQAIVAGVVALQRDKARPRREPVLWRLDEKERSLAVRLAALLQLARALGATPAASLIVHVDRSGTTLAIGGPRAAELAEAAARRGDLWRANIGALTIRPSEPGESGEPVEPISAPNAWESQLAAGVAPADRLDGGEPIAEGARRVLRRFFGRLLAREDAVLKGQDIEDVHQMRVATRRLRAALQVVETVYDADQLRRYRRGLRRISGALADVRDLDVFREHVVTYRDAPSEEARGGVAPLVAAVETQRAHAFAILLKDLDQRRYRKFKHDFAAFLTTPGVGLAAGDGLTATTRVRDFAGSAIWRRYEQWRAHEIALAAPTNEGLHEARIAGKRLRYTLEFFAGALGPNVEQVLAPLVLLQENLGAIQDTVVAQQLVESLGLSDYDAVLAYLRTREAERATQLAELPRLWEKVASATYRRRLFELIVKL